MESGVSFESEKLNDGLSYVEFKYFVPILNKNLEVIPIESSVRYVVGALIKLNEFKKLVEMKCLKLNIEKDFNERIKDSDSVCIVKSMNAGIFPQQVYAIDSNTKIFDTISELIYESKKFIKTLNQFYSLDELESYIDIKL